MITRYLTLTIENGSGPVSVSRGNHDPETVSLRQGSDHIFLDDVDSARDLRDALTELLDDMAGSAK